jgi:hypothetical protein
MKTGMTIRTTARNAATPTILVVRVTAHHPQGLPIRPCGRMLKNTIKEAKIIK